MMDPIDLAIPIILLFYFYRYLWSLCFLSLTIGLCLYVKKQRRKQSTNKLRGNGRGVVITGCDTGIGHATALRLHKLGFTVFAGCLQTSGDGPNILAEEGPDMHVLNMDVTSEESVSSALAFVENNMPKEGIFAVINNAGINIMADVELATMEMYKRVAEVNIYGMIRVTKMFCPLIRKSKGRIINVTSVKGRISLPLDSTYILTKWAGEAFSDILRQELIRFGVKVIIIEPGDFGGLTGMLSKETIRRMENDLNTAWNVANDNVKRAYGREYIDALLDGIKGAGSTNASSLDPVVDAMEDAITNENPQYRYLVDGSSSIMDKYCMLARLKPFLPEGVTDRLIPPFFPLPPVKQKTT